MRPGWEGTAAGLVREGGWVAEITTRSGCVPAKSTHVTWHPVAGLDLWQPTAITLRLVLGKGGQTSLSRFTEPFPQGWKMKCHRGPGVLILRGHKIVRAIATPINKTWGVRRRGRKLWRYSKKNYSVIWVLIACFSQGPILHFLICVLRVREIPRHVPLYITVVSDLRLTLAAVWEIWMWTKPVSAARSDRHQLNRKQQFWGHNFARLVQATAQTLRSWLCPHSLCRWTFPPLFSGSAFEVGRQLALMLQQFRPVLWFRRRELFITGGHFGAVEVCKFVIMQKIIKG